MRQTKRLLGFTMIELLVVIVIIGVLAAALAPAVGRFLRAGDDTISRNNLMRLGKAALAYKSEHDGCYPAAGGYFSEFQWRDPRNPATKEKRYGRANGWVYFEHDCPRKKGDIEAADKIGDGNGDSYNLGSTLICGASDDETYVNEDGCCICFDSKSKEGGMGSKPASWYERSGGDVWTQAQVSVMNGCLFDYLGKDLSIYVNPTFQRLATEKLGIAKNSIVRAYAMNVITGADKSLYDTGRSGYAGGGGSYGIRYGQSTLKPYVDGSTRAEALPSKVALFVELDLDNEALKSANSLEGDQVWDWDEGDECMGFVHEDNGMMYAHVCFADGHVEAIRDPSRDITSPDTTKRKKLSKWYGSGGVSASGEKLD